MQVLVDKSLITISSNMSLQMHDLIQAMAREIVREESIMTGKQRRLWSSSEVYNVLSEKKVARTEPVEVLSLQKFSHKVHIDVNNFAHMKNLRIMKIYHNEKRFSFLRYAGIQNNIREFFRLQVMDIIYHGNSIPEWFTKRSMQTHVKIELPSDWSLSNLKLLDLEGNNFTSLPASLSQLSHLRYLEDRASDWSFSFQPRWWTSITSGIHMLRDLNLRYCNLEQVPESIGGLSCLKRLYLEGNNFTSLPVSLSQLSHLEELRLDGCKKLEGLPELPHSLETIKARDCTSLCSITGLNPIKSKGSLREVLGSYRYRGSYFRNCPKLFKNHVIDSQVSISETQFRDSCVTSQGSTNRFSSFLRYAGIQNNRCGLFRLPGSSIKNLDIIYHANSIPNWFTNKSMGNHVKVKLPSDWSFRKFRGYGICVVFKRKKPSTDFGYSVKNFDGASLGAYRPYYYGQYFQDKPIRIDEPDMIWLHYTTSEIRKWKKAKKFLTFCFYENEEIEVKEMGVRVVCDEDLDQEAADLSMFQDLPTLSQHGGALCLFEDYRIDWSW